MNIPTAEEMLKAECPSFDKNPIEYLTNGELYIKMKEFAKLHVQAALEAIANGTLNDISSWDGNPYTGEGSEYLDRDKILNAYPLTNIK
jgi:hypothetical protein